MPADTQFQSRDEVKKAKELEEARKMGIIPAEKDEEGKDINPHIPQYISKAPWYLNQTVSSLKHQRYKKQEDVSALDDIRVYVRRNEKKRELLNTSYVKGACANCGATTHNEKNCVERPRLKKAKCTGENICPDEYILTPDELNIKTKTFDSKRDRWYGYDNEDYKYVVREYEKADLERKRRKASRIQQLIANAKTKKSQKKLTKRLKKLNETNDDINELSDVSETTSGSDSDSDAASNSDDEDSRIRDFDLTSAPMGSKDDHTRTTTRNLRIREDTAKYLFNLNLNSAFYDPKTRSMRDNPLKNINDKKNDNNNSDDDHLFIYKGDNVARNTGDAQAMKKMELFAWEAYTNGANVNNIAQPTQLELMHREYHDKKSKLEQEEKESLLDKYGGREHLDAPKEIIFSQTCQYVEYSRDGTVIKGSERILAKSKYEEDVCIGNHSNVWGSYFDKETNKWGFACCKNIHKNSDCVSVC